MAGSVTVSIQGPKELDDVRKALLGIINAVKAKQSPLAVIASNLSLLEEAIVGIDQLPANVKADIKGSLELAGVIAGELIAALIS